MDARAWPEVGSPARWTSSRRRHKHDERRRSLPLWQVRRGLGGAVELNGCAQADFSQSVIKRKAEEEAEGDNKTLKSE